jgi:hypothetical protein
MNLPPYFVSKFEVPTSFLLENGITTACAMHVGEYCYVDYFLLDQLYFYVLYVIW